MEVARRRTRRQWDDFYQKQYDERKQQQQKNDNDSAVETLNADAQGFLSESDVKQNDGVNVADCDVNTKSDDESASESETISVDEDDDCKGGDDESCGVAERSRRRENLRNESDFRLLLHNSDSDSDCEVVKGNADDRCLRLRKRRRIVNMEKEKGRVKILGKKRSHSAKHLNLIKILVDSMNAFEEKQNVPESALPSRFRFEDEVVLPPHKSEHEKFIDELFHDLELGLRQIDCTNLVAESDELKTSVEIDGSCCYRGKHQAILDEQIGLICKHCDIVLMDIKHVLPPFVSNLHFL